MLQLPSSRCSFPTQNQDTQDTLSEKQLPNHRDGRQGRFPSQLPLLLRSG